MSKTIEIHGGHLHDVEAYSQLGRPATLTPITQVIGISLEPITQWTQALTGPDTIIGAQIYGGVPGSGMIYTQGPGTFLFMAHAVFTGDNGTVYTVSLFRNNQNVGTIAKVRAIQNDINVSFTSLFVLSGTATETFDARVQADKPLSNFSLKGGGLISLRLSILPGEQ
jgi:hypothetical protein